MSAGKQSRWEADSDGALSKFQVEIKYVNLFWVFFFFFPSTSSNLHIVYFMWAKSDAFQICNNGLFK